MSLDADLATLHRLIHTPESQAALDRVETKLARLRDENQRVLSNIKDEAVQTIHAKEYGSEQFQRAKVAEAKLARLRDGLREIDNYAQTQPYPQACALIQNKARALLADTPDDAHPDPR